MLRKPLGKNWIIIIILTNILMIVLLAFLTLNNFNGYERKIKDQSISELIRLNKSAGNITYSNLESKQTVVNNLKKYFESDDFTYNDAIEILKNTNTNNYATIQLINTNYVEGNNLINTGIAFFANGTTQNVDYSNSDYEILQKRFVDEDLAHDFKNLSVIEQFTDSATGLQSIAIHVHITLKGETDINYKKHALMIVIRSSTLENDRIWSDHYKNVTSSLINTNGDIIVGDDFISTQNLFQYLEGMSILTINQSMELKEFLTNKTGEEGYLKYYSNNIPYIFTYYLVETNSNWYMISYIPENSLTVADDIEITYIIVLSISFVLLLAFNILWLSVINHKLKGNLSTLSEANAAKTDFLSRMSHDMRTPMNGILGMSELGYQSDDSSEIKTYLKNINTSGKYLLNLINDTLDMNKIESGKMTLNYSVVNFNKYIDDTLLLFNSAIYEKELDLKINKKTNLDYYVELDEIRVKQIITNILSNSLKFTPNGGSINFEVKTNIVDGIMRCEISISDTGIGMSEEFLKHIYEPFSQENSSRSKNITGTGLGMSIVKNLVDSMQGSIEIFSQLGIGTTTIIKLDFIVSKEEIVGEETYDARCLVGKKILLVEDHPMNVVIVKKLLESVGMIVDNAENGLIGVEMFMDKLNYYDLILMDIKMPVMDGLQATREIRKYNNEYAKQIPIIAMTANAFQNDVDECIKAGMNAHLSKPVDTKKLYITLFHFLKNTNK